MDHMLDQKNKDKPVSDSIFIAQKQMMDQFKLMESVYAKLVKMGFVGKDDESDEKFDQQVQEKLARYKPTIGKIERDTREEAQ